MTMSELMLHFNINERYYDRVSNWLCEHVTSVLHQDNGDRKRFRLYDVEKFEQLYPYKDEFGTRFNTDVVAAATLLAEAINTEYDTAITSDEIIKGFAKSKDRESFIRDISSTVQQNELFHGDISRWYDEIKKMNEDKLTLVRNLLILAVVANSMGVLAMVFSIVL